SRKSFCRCFQPSVQTERNPDEYIHAYKATPNCGHSAHRLALRRCFDAEGGQLARAPRFSAAVPAPIVPCLLQCYRADADWIRLTDVYIRAFHGSGRAVGGRLVRADDHFLEPA